MDDVERALRTRLSSETWAIHDRMLALVREGNEAATRRACEDLARGLTLLLTVLGADGRPYLSRYVVEDRGVEARCFLHHFEQDDPAPPLLHSHPWNRARSLVLTGGYVEHRQGYSTTYRPGMVNVLERDDYHRVELLGGDCWTLFMTTRVMQTWFFLDPATGKRTPWREGPHRTMR